MPISNLLLFSGQNIWIKIGLSIKSNCFLREQCLNDICYLMMYIKIYYHNDVLLLLHNVYKDIQSQPEAKVKCVWFSLCIHIDFVTFAKGAVMQIWKSRYRFVFI